MNTHLSEIRLYNKRDLLLIAVALLILLTAAEAIFIRLSYKKTIQQKTNELQTTNNLKSALISAWLKEREADALHFSLSPLYSDALWNCLQNPDSLQEKKITERNEMIRRLRGFNDIHYVFNHKALTFSSKTGNYQIPVELHPLIDSAMHHHSIVLSGFYKDPLTGKLSLASIAPITNSDGNTFATLVFYINPEEYLFKLLQFSPDNSTSITSLLVSEYQGFYRIIRPSIPTDTSQINTLRLSPSNAYLNHLQKRSAYKGQDPFGQEVIATWQEINQMPWQIITQQEVRPALQGFYQNSTLQITGGLLLIGLVSLSLSWMYQNHERKTYKTLLEKEHATANALQTSESQLRALIETSYDGILFIDINAIISFTTPSLSRITGIPIEQTIHKNMFELFEASHVSYIENKLKKLIVTQESFTTQARMKGSDNTLRWVEVSMFNHIDNPHLKSIVVQIRDVHESKKNQKKYDELHVVHSAILENAGYAIITTNDQGTITLFNRAAEQMLGYQSNEVIGIQTPMLIHDPVEIERHAKHLSAKYQQKFAADFHALTFESIVGCNQVSEWTFIRKDGKRIPVALKVTALKDKVGRISGYMGIAIDLAEQKDAQENIRKSEQKYRLLFENINSAFAFHKIEFDPEHQPVNYQFIDINQQYKEMWDVDDSVIGQSVFNVIPGIQQSWLMKVKDLIDSGTPIFQVDHIPSKNIYIEISAFKIDNDHFAMLINDITDRIHAENELRKSEQKFADIFRMIPDAVGLIRSSNNAIIDANPSFSIITGFEREEYIGKTSFDLNLYPNQSERENMLNLFYEKKEVINYETSIRTKSNEIRNCLFSLKHIYYNEEDCILFVIHDITELKMAELALKNEQSFTNSILESIPGLISLYNEDGELIRWNQKRYAELGYSYDELYKKPLLSWFIPEHHKSVLENISRVKEEGKGEIEATVIGKNGQQKHYYFTAVRSTFDNQMYFTSIGFDITERKLANELLKETEQRFLNIYNLTPDMVGITKLSDGSIISANPAMTVMTGFTPEEYIGRSTLELGLWADPEDRNRMVSMLKEYGEVLNWESKMRIKDGTVLAIIFSSRPLVFNNEPCLLFVVHDITTRKMMEEKLQKSEIRLRRAQSIGQIGISEQFVNNPLIWASSEAKAIYGFEPVEGYIHKDEIIRCIPDIEIIRNATQELINTGKRFDIEFAIFPVDGSPKRYIHAIMDIERAADGNTDKIYTIFQNVTERKQIEMEIRNLNETLEKRVEERTEQLRQSNQDLESFAYSVSHDLRAPLRHIDGFIKLLYSQIQQPSPAIVNYYQKINLASHRMSEMIDNLLTFSRLGRKELTIQETDLNEIVKELIEQHTPDLINRNIQWSIQPLPTIKGDPAMLKMAFENLLGNALKYTNKKEIAIIEIGISQINDEFVTLFIKDNGVGFDMTYINKLFGVFQRLHTSDEFEGTGIGLANTKQIITKHGGTINAMGYVNQGATFFINLPINPYR